MSRSCTLWLALLLAACSKRSAERSESAPSSVEQPQPSPSVVASAAASPAPTVDLSGQYHPPPVAGTPGGQRIFARALRTWIYESPRAGAQRLGTLRAGMSLPVVKALVGRDGCPSGWWHAVAPAGYVCAGEDATLDEHDPLVRVLREYGADPSAALPFTYGTVRRPGPIYRRLPTESELERSEPDLQRRMQAWLMAPGETGANYAQHVWTPGPPPALEPKVAWESRQSDPLPWFLSEGNAPPKLPGKAASDDPLLLGKMEPSVGYSILKTFLHNGRRYGLTSDLALVPTDRLRPIQGSRFHGFRIPEEIDFPFAIVRAPGARHYRLDTDKKRLVAADPAEYRSALRLTGKQQFYRGRLHFETASDTWLSDSEASRLDPARRMPAWGRNGEKWIDVNITKQTLVLYEGTKAVYATLVSTGEAGLEDAEDSTATQRGIFRIHTKFISATMDSDAVGEEFELRDVPYVQYFEKGYALHGAYWHDRFGIPKSHGCINLSPEDARRIFFWTEPAVPQGWYSVLKPLRGTVLFVHP